MYHGTVWDYATFFGTIGLFLSLLFLFIRFLPVISIAEMRELVHETQEQERHGRAVGTAGGRAMSTAHRRRPSRLRPDGRVRQSRGRCSRRPGDAYERGYRMMEAYSPVPGRGAGRGARRSSATGSRRSCFIGGVLGGLGGLLHAVVLGRDQLPDQRRRAGRFNSWPAFIPITFEMTILVAALAAVFGMLGLNGLPRPLSPGLQRAELRAGVAQPVLPLHPGARPAVRPRGDARVPRRAQAQGDHRGPVLNDRPRGSSRHRRCRSTRRLRQRRSCRGRRWLAILAAGAARSAGCRSEMYDQPRYEPLEPSTFFEDGTSARPLVAGTVPRDDPRATPPGASRTTCSTRAGTTASSPRPSRSRSTARSSSAGRSGTGSSAPPATASSGDGRGMIVRRGFTPPPPYLQRRAAQASRSATSST